MSTSTTVVEVIKFTSQGVPEIVAQTKVMARETQSVTQRYTTLLGLVNNPAFVKHAAWLERMARSHELISMRLRNQAYAQRVADGSAARQMRAAQQLNAEYARMQRRVELTARYGERLGGFLATHGAALSKVGGMMGIGLTSVAGMGVGLARQGFEGTVEKNRLTSELSMISRELAGAFKPVMDVATKFAKVVRQRLEKTGESGQNAIMTAGIVGTAGASLTAFRAVANTIGAVAGETMASKFRGMALRGAAGLAGAGLLTYGVAAGNVTSGALGGAILGFSVGGPVGALAGGVAGGLTAKAQGTPTAMGGEGPAEYWSRLRRSGRSWGGTAIDTGLEGISETYHWMFSGFKDVKQRHAEREAESRRQVQLAGGGFEDMDSYYTRLTSAVEKKEGERELTGAMRDLADELRRRDSGLSRPAGGT